jgi:hypothetical protein
MEAELIRQYARRMTIVYAEKVFRAKQTGSEGYLLELENRRDFWKQIAQLSPDSEHWELVARYINLDLRTSKGRRKALYRFLQEAMKLKASVKQII